ncbi:MAG: THUMP domain-containing protein [Candidatus Nanohaloarchaeota archaeon QJJ-5]|nr:THUMP domain-containing protein [Candidatus Nanohaloarchaeota archaeon QJJ-5]
MKAIVTAPGIRLKSSSVETTMFDRLVANVTTHFDRANHDARIFRDEGRIFVEAEETEMPAVVETLMTIPGIKAIMPCVETDRSLEAIEQAIPGVIEGIEAETFGIDAKRVGEHDLGSREIEQTIGAVVEDLTDWDVDLDDPDCRIRIEARYEKAFIYTDRFEGVGGLPIHPENRVVVPLRDRLDCFAAYLLMKRGCEVTPVVLDNEQEGLEEAIQSLQQYQPALKLLTLSAESWQDAVTSALEHVDAEAVGLGVCVDDLPMDEDWNLDVPVLTPVSGHTEAQALDGYTAMLHPDF